MGLLDVFTGGKSSEAGDAFKRAEAIYGNLKTPTKEDLLLPKLQEYVNAGLMTPAQAQTYLQEHNALDDSNIDQTGTRAQIEALNQLSGVANAGPNGTPMEQAQVEAAIQKANQATAGQRGAIQQEMQARGVPAAMIQAAMMNQSQGIDAQQAHNDAMQAQAQAYQHAVDAMAKGGEAGSNLQGQQNTQANTVGAAQNAMEQFNAANRSRTSEANAGRTQEANAYDIQNKQQVSNNNTGNANARTQYNAGVPQTVYQDELSKASGQAGAAQNYGDLIQKQGQQNAGIWSGLINTATSFIPKPPGAGGSGGMPTGLDGGKNAGDWQGLIDSAKRFLAKPAGAGGSGSPGGVEQSSQFSSPFDTYKPSSAGMGYAHGGITGPESYADGAIIPGHAKVPGDSELNDTVTINTSPGEAIIPRTKTQEHLPEILSILSGKDGGDQGNGDVQDVATLLKALRSIRLGVA